MNSGWLLYFFFIVKLSLALCVNIPNSSAMKLLKSSMCNVQWQHSKSFTLENMKYWFHSILNWQWLSITGRVLYNRLLKALQWFVCLGKKYFLRFQGTSWKDLESPRSPCLVLSQKKGLLHIQITARNKHLKQRLCLCVCFCVCGVFCWRHRIFYCFHLSESTQSEKNILQILPI